MSRLDEKDTGETHSSHQRWQGQPIGIRDEANLSYDEFVRSYMAPNVPVLIKGAAKDFYSFVFLIA
eukprot:scaffold177279_cov38-Prasinocladus_malaysianus.AAC.1